MDAELHSLQRKVTQYKEIVRNTRAYRDVWLNGLRDHIVQQLEYLAKETNMDATVEVRSELENLEAVILSLGTVKSASPDVSQSRRRYQAASDQK